jgi:peroxiredoxin
MNKIKLLITSCICILQLVSFAQEKKYKIYGTAKGNYTGNVFLFFENNYKEKDSICCPLKDGKFYFEGNVKMPIVARVHLSGSSFIGDFYLEKSTTYVSCNFVSNVNGKDTINGVTIESVKDSKSFPLQKQMLDTLFKAMRTAKGKDSTVFKIYLDFIAKHPDSRVGAYYLGTYYSCLTYDEINQLKRLFSSSLNETFEMGLVNEVLVAIKNAELRAPGLAFHDIFSKDTSGNTISTKDFRGKYLLVVCWATWCKPCRAEHPALNALYEKYKGQGLEMLGVSFDAAGSEQKWKQAIVKDGMKWPQVADMRGSDTDFSNYYQIHSIPCHFLVDKEGKIIGSGLSLGEVETLLKKELNN